MIENYIYHARERLWRQVAMSEELDSSSTRFKRTLTQMSPVFLGILFLTLTAAVLYTPEPFKTLSAFFTTFILAAMLSLTGKESYIARRGGARKYLIWPWTITMVVALGYRDLAIFLVPAGVFVKELLLALSAGIVVLGLLKAYYKRR